jgi:TolB protein
LNEEGLTRLTRDPASEGIASWSPDGKRLVFSSDRDGDWDLYLLSLANGAARRLTSDPGTDTFPAWSPDGKAIAFVSDRSGNADIYLMDAPTLED